MLRKIILILMVSFLSSCGTTQSTDDGSVKRYSSYRSCQLDLPIYLNSGESAGDSENEALNLALSVLAQSVEVDIETLSTSDVSKNNSDLRSSFSETVNLESKVTISGYQVACKTEYQGKHYLTLTYDNRGLGLKLINVLNDLNVANLGNLNGPKLLLESPLFKDAFGCDTNSCSGPYNGDVNVRLSEVGSQWYLNVGDKQLRVAGHELHKLIALEGHSNFTLTTPRGELITNNRLKNGDVFQMNYASVLGQSSILNVYVLAEDGSLTSLIENRNLSSSLTKLEPLQSCMMKNEYHDCVDIPNTISVDRFLAVETLEPVPTFFIDKMNFNYSKEKAINTNRLPNLIRYFSKNENQSIVSLVEVITSPINE